MGAVTPAVNAMPVDLIFMIYCITLRRAGPVSRWPGRATSAHVARIQGEAAGIERLRPDVAALFASQDAAEGVQSLIERRQARLSGR